MFFLSAAEYYISNLRAPHEGLANPEMVLRAGLHSWWVAFELGHDGWARDLHEERAF